MSMKNTTIIKVDDNEAFIEKQQRNGAKKRADNDCSHRGCNTQQVVAVAVEALFDFCFKKDGQKICLNRGDKYCLLEKTNKDWWLIKRLDENQSRSDYRSDGEDADTDCNEGGFYAPASYLREVKMNVNAGNTSGVGSGFGKQKGELTSNSLNDSEYSCDSGDDFDSGNQDYAEISSNTAATSSRESLIDEINCDDINNCDNSMYSGINECNDNQVFVRVNSRRMESPPIYVNLPTNLRNLPPTPNTGATPIRVLLNHWAEYLDLNGRKYYYNSVTGDSSWKPPRNRLHVTKDDEDVTSHSEENLTDSSTASLSTLASNKDARCNRSPKPFSRTSPTLTKGWSRHTDMSTNTIYFTNEKTKGKWFCKLDENGRLYFYEENGKKSFWELPELAELTDDTTNDEMAFETERDANNANAIASTDSSPKDKDDSKPEALKTSDTPLNENIGRNSLPRKSHFVATPCIPSPVTLRHRFLGLDRSIKAKSMAFLPINDRLAAQTMTASLPKKEYVDEGTQVTPPEPPSTLNDAKLAKKGVLNRTKIMENGRRIRKNWSPCFVALTDYYLMLFRETKLITGSLKPEMTVELSGALIEWSQKSSRKNVFQITTVAGQQILLQDDCPINCKSWFDTIRSAIIKLPTAICAPELNETETESRRGECKLKRSKSSKQYRKADNNGKEAAAVVPIPSFTNIPAEKKKKIRERLRQFLRRRPTLDLIREKGIYKDEPVFGCNLMTLCQSEKQNVPKFVKQCIEAIEKKDLKADGIYRACGNLSQVQKIRFQVNQDNYSGIWTEEDVHVLTGALKLFFRDMKEPLFPCPLFDPLMRAICLTDKKSKFDAILKLVKELPAPNYDTLKYLLQHLLRVKDYSDENRMHIQNLAIVFGPTLMRPECDSNNFAYDMMLRMHSNQAIEFLLLEYNNIFE